MTYYWYRGDYVEEKKYCKVYESEVENATVRITKRYNVDLLAKAVIMIADDYLAIKGNEGDKDGNGR